MHTTQAIRACQCKITSIYSSSMIIGAHVSAAVSLELSFNKATEIGAQATQIFISPPRQWFQGKHNKEEIDRYKLKQIETGITPNFIHGTYLVNLGTSDQNHLQKSIDWLIYSMNMAAELEMEGVIFHLGSHKGVGFEKVLDQVIKSLIVILETTKLSIESQKRDAIGPSDLQLDMGPSLILENSAGAGATIGDNFKELGQIIKRVGDARLKVCLDTCHAYAEGYDVKTKEGLDKTLEEFDKEIGLEKLAVIHANDSKFALGSNKDRHANIGEGFIGLDGFTNLVNHPKLENIPFILEVPGFSGKGPDAENVQKLKSLIGA